MGFCVETFFLCFSSLMKMEVFISDAVKRPALCAGLFVTIS